MSQKSHKHKCIMSHQTVHYSIVHFWSEMEFFHPCFKFLTLVTAHEFSQVRLFINWFIRKFNSPSSQMFSKMLFHILLLSDTVRKAGLNGLLFWNFCKRIQNFITKLIISSQASGEKVFVKAELFFQNHDYLYLSELTKFSFFRCRKKNKGDDRVKIRFESWKSSIIFLSETISHCHLI